MTDSLRGPEVANYLAEVRRRLVDLPPVVREDLLADLEAHLNEVAADLEPDATLAGRLGTPETYAAELRETVVVEGDTQVLAPARSRLTAARSRLAAAREAAGKAADAVAGSAGMGTFAELREKVRPGWWILRGAAAGILLCYLVLRADSYFMRGAVENFSTAFWIFAAVALIGAWASLRLGTHSAQWRPAYRYTIAFGGMIVVLWAGWTAVNAVGFSAFVSQYSDAYFSASQQVDPYSGVTDIYAYDEDGELLTDVYLLDQRGMPLYMGDPASCSGGDPLAPDDNDPYGPDDAMGFQYPLCMSGDSTEESAVPSESADEEPTSAESSEEAPSDEATPSGATPSEAEPTATPSEDEPTTAE